MGLKAKEFLSWPTLKVEKDPNTWRRCVVQREQGSAGRVMLGMQKNMHKYLCTKWGVESWFER